MTRWVAMICSEETEALQTLYPNAFLLMCQIARRAKWKDCPVSKLRAGQAFIGDWKKAGLKSDGSYRRAKGHLEKSGLATFRATNKGTIATICDSTIFNVEMKPDNEQATSKRRTRDEPPATNHTDRHTDGETDITRIIPAGTSPGPVARKPSPLSSKIRWDEENGFQGIEEADHTRWAAAYPAADLSRQIAAASEWLRANPARRKKNHLLFLTNWLSRAQERGGDPRPARPAYGEVKDYAVEGGAPEGTAEAFFDKMEQFGWRGREGPVVDWRAAYRAFVGSWTRIQMERSAR